jgi:predicted transcriptional regulator
LHSKADSETSQIHQQVQIHQRQQTKQAIRSAASFSYLLILLQEHIMKKSITTLFLALSAIAGVAQADVTTNVDQNRTQVHRQQGKTRAEVRNELAQAQKDGQIAALANLYRGS